MALDDTRLRKTGRAIQQAFYQRDPLSPPFHVNLMLGLRFLQASLLVPLHRNTPGRHAGFADSLPGSVARQTPRQESQPRRMQQQYKEAVKRQNLSRSFVEMGKQLRQELDEAGGRRKDTGVGRRRQFLQSHLLRRNSGTIVLLVARPQGCQAVFSAPQDGPRRFYGTEKFTPEQVRKDDSRGWKTTKIFYGGKRRKIRYKEVAGSVLARRRRTSVRCG